MFERIKDNLELKKRRKRFENTYIDSNKNNNMIISKNLSLSNNTIKTRRNNNIVVLDKEDSKYYSFIKPNLEQMNSNYIIVDNDGKLYDEFCEKFNSNGYLVQVIDLINFNGNYYNPLLYVNNDNDLLFLNISILESLNIDKNSFEFRTKLPLLNTITFYMMRHCQRNELCFIKINELLKNFENLKKEIIAISKTNSNDIVKKQLDAFIDFSGNSQEKIINELRNELKTLFNNNILKITENVNFNENVNLSFNKKSIIFIKVSNLKSNKNIFLPIILMQMINYILTFARDLPRKEYNEEIKIFLDDFAKIGNILEFTKTIAVSRMYKVSFAIFLDNFEELKEIYTYDWESLIGNCDSILYFKSTKKAYDYILLNTIYRKDKQIVWDFVENKTLDANNIDLLDSHCIYLLRGNAPILDQKYF